MNNKLNFLLLLVISIFLCSCADSKESKKLNPETINLEKYLSKSDYVKLNMKKMPSGHLHLLGQLNGVNGNFILDTGAGATVIEEKNKDKFKMKTQAVDEKATGAGGTDIQMQSSENNNFKFDNLEFSELDLMLMNLDHVNNAFESLGLDKVDGVIGADILTSYNAIIDYTNMAIYFKK